MDKRLLEVWHAKQLAIPRDQSIVLTQSRNLNNEMSNVDRGIKIFTSDKNDGNRLKVAYEGRNDDADGEFDPQVFRTDYFLYKTSTQMKKQEEQEGSNGLANLTSDACLTKMMNLRNPSSALNSKLPPSGAKLK
jgi:hypothetical protein